MSNPVQTTAQTSSKPSFTSVPGWLLQRKCACGDAAGLAGDCEECSGKQLSVQRSAANEAGPRAANESRRSPDQLINAPSRAVMESLGHNFGDVGVAASNAAPDQTKLRMSQPGDQYELEADRLADRMLAQLATSGAHSSRGAAVGDAIGKFEDGGVVDKLMQPSPAPGADASVGQSASETNAQVPLRSLPRAGRNLANHLPGSYGTGRPLAAETRGVVEPLLGYDLQTVRIFPKEADQVAADINARAFTLGRDIYFRDGEYSPDSREGMRVLLHELVHTTQPDNDGGMLQLTPSIAAWDFHTAGTAASDNCCTACPGLGLGVNTAFYGAGSFTNGMELQAFINDNEASATYDIKRVKERSAWQRIGGSWGLCCGGHVGPGADDDPPPNSLDECLTPNSRPPTLDYIYSVDEPGFNSTTGFAATATEAVYKASFTEFVEITSGLGGTATDAKAFDWHSITWLTKASGSWALDPAKSEIAAGAITVGSTGP